MAGWWFQPTPLKNDGVRTSCWLVVLTILKNIKVNGKDYPILWKKMFESTNQVGMMTFPTEWTVIKFHGSKPPSRW